MKFIGFVAMLSALSNLLVSEAVIRDDAKTAAVCTFKKTTKTTKTTKV